MQTPTANPKTKDALLRAKCALTAFGVDHDAPDLPLYTVIVNNRPPYEFTFMKALEFALMWGAWYLEPSTYNTVAYQSSLNDEEKLNLLKESKTGKWYDGWKPYCLTCSTLDRMAPRQYGFECQSCGDIVGFNLMRLEESPLNES